MCLAVHWRLLLVERFTAFPVCLLSFDLFSASVYGEPISEALELYSSEADSCGPVPGARVWPPGNRDAEFGAVGQTSGRGWVEGVPEEVLAQINCCCGKKTVCTTLFTSIFIERSISDLSGRGPIFYILLFLFPLFSSFSEVSLTIKV